MTYRSPAARSQRTSALRTILVLAFCFGLIGAAPAVQAAEATSLDTAAIEAAIGIKGTLNLDEQVYKVSVPRTDVPITVDGNAMPPFMGLTSWAAFQADPQGGVMVMSDLVLFEDEVNPVMSVLLDHGVSVTALHNHFFFDTPHVYFMHLGGTGPIATLAAGVRAGLDQVKAIRAATPQPGTTFGRPKLPAVSSITGAALESVFGVKPAAKDGMVKFVFGRSVAMPCGCKVGKEMGVNTWSAFMGTDAAAVVDGDFATVAGELQPVLKSLRKAGINIVAIHSHMEDETPKIIFLHYWGIGAAPALAAAIKSALDAQRAVPAKP